MKNPACRLAQTRNSGGSSHNQRRRFQNCHRRRQENEGRQKWPALLKVVRHARRSQRGRDAGKEVPAATKRYPSDEPAEGDQQSRADGYQSGKS